ncbi:PP2A regulatory subunit TAP46-like protein [Sesbania bispinosa]|nr:PP2A regulatory subunit TAP46-like protein [Sesbania bispinosa]
MEDMPLPVLFEKAQKIHQTATESRADGASEEGLRGLNRCWTWLISWVCSLPMKLKTISTPLISSTFWYLFSCLLTFMK